MMLDSGAFSAWTRKESIDLKAYIKFIKLWQPHLWQYVALDSIPGKLGTTRTQAEVAASAQLSYDNLQRMKDAGLKPMPVFHQGESFEYLERMLADGEDYMGLAPLKDNAMSIQLKWLDKVFTLITDDAGQPLVKTHGFGATHAAYMLRYPWFTCDSTTWLLTPAYGQIFVPPLVNGKFDYTKRPMRVHISGVATDKHSKRVTFAGSGPHVQGLVLKWLAEEAGVSMLKARNSHWWRRTCLIIYFQRFAAHTKGIRFTHRQNSFAHKVKGFNPKPLKGLEAHVVFATNTSREQAAILTHNKVRHRLLSYYDLQRDDTMLMDYIYKGNHGGTWAPTRPPQNWRAAYVSWRRLELEKHLQREISE